MRTSVKLHITHKSMVCDGALLSPARDETASQCDATVQCMVATPNGRRFGSAMPYAAQSVCYHDSVFCASLQPGRRRK